ncbi:MAG: hypothetical protein GY913_26755 [Proteobacteria bacterium]|nr:hypothetical protein [Pseudomonadota bacterium]MCP4920515.1 hypothetical protein [Pseudomonadota bacterium]
MKRVLLILSTTRYSKASLDGALAEARQIRDGGEEVALHVLYIRETEELAQVKSTVDGDAFLGAGPQAQIIESLEKQHHATAVRRIERGRRGAAELGIPFSANEVQGDYLKLAQAETADHDVVYLSRADRPYISRLLFGSAAESVARLVRKEGHKVVINDATPPAWGE